MNPTPIQTPQDAFHAFKVLLVKGCLDAIETSVQQLLAFDAQYGDLLGAYPNAVALTHAFGKAVKELCAVHKARRSVAAHYRDLAVTWGPVFIGAAFGLANGLGVVPALPLWGIALAILGATVLMVGIPYLAFAAAEYVIDTRLKKALMTLVHTPEEKQALAQDHQASFALGQSSVNAWTPYLRSGLTVWGSQEHDAWYAGFADEAVKVPLDAKASASL